MFNFWKSYCYAVGGVTLVVGGLALLAAIIKLCTVTFGANVGAVISFCFMVFLALLGAIHVCRVGGQNRP